MSLLIDSIKKGPVMTMTLECETEFPISLKDNMKTWVLKEQQSTNVFLSWIKDKNIGGWNSTCTKAKMMTTRPKGVAWSPAQYSTLHSLIQQEVQLGKPSSILEQDSKHPKVPWWTQGNRGRVRCPQERDNLDHLCTRITRPKWCIDRPTCGMAVPTFVFQNPVFVFQKNSR